MQYAAVSTSADSVDGDEDERGAAGEQRACGEQGERNREGEEGGDAERGGRKLGRERNEGAGRAAA